ncbi:Hypothetical predicted protein, partial [Paramuricea clavata]
MAEKKFALVFWSDDQQNSVVAYEDIVGEAKLGEILPVAWRIRKKKGEVKTCWYEAKILQLSQVDPSQKDEVQTQDDDPFSSPANMPPNNFMATNMPIHSTNSHKSSNQRAWQELQLLGETNPDWPDETP